MKVPRVSRVSRVPRVEKSYDTCGMSRKIRIILFATIFAGRYLFYFSSIKKLPDGHLKITGTIKEEPSVFDKSQQVRVEGYKIYLPLHPSITLGDKVIIEGEAQEGILKKGKLVSLEESRNPLYSFRKQLLSFYSSVLPTDMAALVAGCVIGSKQLLTSDFWDKLTATGTAHVVVASGMNVTIVTKFILDLLILFLPRRKAIPFALGGVWLYAALAGFGAPIIRATIMGSLTFGAQELGKLSSALRVFFITLLGMILWKPEWLWDISFLLTCTATLSIMLLQKPIERKLKRVPEILRNDFTTSLAASAGVTPILWWNFGQFNLLSPFINALVLWTIAPITLVGGVAGIVGVMVMPLGKIMLYLIYPLTWWFINVINVFS